MNTTINHQATTRSAQCLQDLNVYAARTRDVDDLRLLSAIIGVESADEALRICADFYPDEPVPQRSIAVLRELFG